MKFLFLVFAMFFALTSLAKIDSANVYVVANKKSKDSKAIAEYYCKVRNIPKSNIIELSVPDKDTLSRVEYQNNLANPLVAELSKRSAIEASEIFKDAQTSRPTYLFISQKVDFLVLCKMPFRIASSSSGKGPSTSAASVDSELAATFLQMKSLQGMVRNPLYEKYDSPDLYKTLGVLRVARLDGKNFDEAKSIIDSAIFAERNGARGRAYIDKNKRSGGYKLGNIWLAKAEDVLKKMHFDMSVDSASALFGYDVRMDAPLFYFGWYSGSPYGYLAEKKFKAPSGAVGLHLYSFSASYLRKSGWTTVLMNDSFAQSYGNVYEPYLTGTQNIGAIMSAYEKGLSAGEVAYASIAILSWQSLVVGDPLYQPFKVSLEEQMNRIDNGKVDALSQYSVIRQMNKMKSEGSSNAQLIDFSKKYIGKMPDIALRWKLSKIFKDENNSECEKQILLDLYNEKIWQDTSFVGLSMELADRLKLCKKYSEAMDIYNKFGELKYSKNFFKTLVKRAYGLSKSSGMELSDKFAKLKKIYDAEEAEAKRKAAERKAKQEASKRKLKPKN